MVAKKPGWPTYGVVETKARLALSPRRRVVRTLTAFLALGALLPSRHIFFAAVLFAVLGSDAPGAKTTAETDTSLPARRSIRGGNNERKYHDELTCRLSLFEFIDSQDHPNRKRTAYMCSPLLESGKVGDREYEVSTGIDNALQAEHWQTLQEDLETFVIITRCEVDERNGRIRLTESSRIRLNASYHRTRRRKLADHEGTLSALVVRIVMNDKQPMYSKDELYRIVFQERVSIRNQYRACSFGKLRVEPSSLGVVTARVNRNTFQSTNKNAVNDAAVAALAYVNSATGQSYESLTEYADMILYVTPAMGDFLAYASVGGGQSVYNDKWGGFVASHMHETGHNLFLLHAWEGEEYLDYTGYMGGAIVGYHDRVGFPAMCYNAENLWNLGWYDDRKTELDLDNPSLLKIAAFVDYDKTTAGREHVLAKAGNIYFHYNRAKGMNKDTYEYQDHLVLYQGTPMGSFLFAALHYPDKPSYDRTFPQGAFHAEICEQVDGDGSSTPDYLVVSIGFGASLCSQEYQATGSSAHAEPTATVQSGTGRPDKPPPNDDDFYYDDYAP